MLAARDAEWRAAVERVRTRRADDIADWATGEVLDEIIAAMEAK